MFKSLFLPIAAACGLFAAPLAAETIELDLEGDIADGAQVLSAPFEEEIRTRLARIEQETGASIVLVTMKNLAGAASGDIAKEIGQALEKGQKVEKHWVVFLLAPNEREFSATFSTSMPNGMTAEELVDEKRVRDMLQTFVDLFEPAVTPHFRDDRWEDGVRAGVEAVEANLNSDNAPPPPNQAKEAVS